MDFLFFDRDDNYIFMRNDAQEAVVDEIELNLTASFPVDSTKMIEDGMRIGYYDADNNFQLFEIRILSNDLYENMQAIVSAEHVCISELTDEIVEYEAPTASSAQEALVIALTDTIWEVGTYIPSSDDATEWDMKNVWACVCDIRDTWGVRIVPRLTISGTAITHRYLDIVSATPVNRGVRLEVNKNIEQAGVTYDDHVQYTALYGLGKEIASDTGSERLTFSGIEWATPTNPANKPIGQKWVEDTAATALYGRNGRKRVGVVEFPDIEDVYDLIDATWLYLQASLVPKVTIECTIHDLYNLGYSNEKILLNDVVTCIIDPLGVETQLAVSGMRRDLLRPENTKPTIGVIRSSIEDVINANILNTQTNGRIVRQPSDALNTGYIAIYRNVTKILNALVQIQTDDFQLLNLAGNNMLRITDADEATGEPGARLKLGDTGYPVDIDNDTVIQPKNGGTGYTSGQVHRLYSIPDDALGIDGDIAVRYSGGGGGFADIYPSIGAHTTATYFGKNREWDYERISGWRSVGNTSGALTGSFWSFTTPAAGMSFATLTFTCGKYIGGVWYGWNLSLPITVGVFSGTGSSTPLATGTFTPSNTPDSVSIPLSFATPLTGSTTYYLAIYDNAASYNKSRALIQASTVVLTGDASDTPVGLYVKAGGAYVDVTAAVLALLNDHVADTDNPHGVTASQAGAVPTSRTVNSKALSSNITLDAGDVGAVPTSRTVNGHALTSDVTVTLSDVGGAAASHAHGNIASDGKIGSAADQIVVTGTGGGVTIASPGVLKLLLAIAMSDVGTTAGITDIQVGTADPGTLATGVLYLKREA